MDKEIHIRKKVEKDMLLRQEDFPSLLEFNDYLEAMETIVFNLVNGVDLEGTKKKMEGMKDRFKKELQKAKGARFKSKDQEFLAQVLEEERSSMDDGARRAFDAQVFFPILVEPFGSGGGFNALGRFLNSLLLP